MTAGNTGGEEARTDDHGNRADRGHGYRKARQPGTVRRWKRGAYEMLAQGFPAFSHPQRVMGRKLLGVNRWWRRPATLSALRRVETVQSNPHSARFEGVAVDHPHRTRPVCGSPTLGNAETGPRMANARGREKTGPAATGTMARTKLRSICIGLSLSAFWSHKGRETTPALGRLEETVTSRHCMFSGERVTVEIPHETGMDMG